MAKARRKLEGDLKKADAVLMVVDARVPRSGRHHDLEQSLSERGKPLLFALTKGDLAEEQHTKSWLKQLRSESFGAVSINAQKGRGPGSLEPHLRRLTTQINEKRQAKGLRPREPRLVVVGLPNVGKSSLLNRLAGSQRAKTGRKPGVTRGQQWVKVSGKWSVLDTPGILYPRIEDERQLAFLAAVGSVKADVLPMEEVGGYLLEELRDRPEASKLLGDPPYPERPFLLERLAQRKGFLMSGARPDLERGCRWLLSSFFEGKLGKITLERPDETN